jgi:membrane protease YdiL (CAAX protease family)
MATGIGFLAPVLKIGEPLILLTAYWAGFTVLRNLLRKFPLNNTSQTVAEIFGLTVRVRKVIVWAIVLIALTTLGDLGVIWMADLFGFEIHWTEWFLEDLVWGNYLELGLLLIAVIVAAPIFEELLFRGLIFATLRQHFSFGAAAISSAALFSIWHGYGIAGSCALLWGSCLSAWSVEKTKSLLPAIIAHTANNFLMALGLIVYLRV